ncbi:hypothetical protein ACLOJK_033222 [Asimina triloba]
MPLFIRLVTVSGPNEIPIKKNVATKATFPNSHSNPNDLHGTPGLAAQRWSRPLLRDDNCTVSSPHQMAHHDRLGHLAWIMNDLLRREDMPPFQRFLNVGMVGSVALRELNEQETDLETPIAPGESGEELERYQLVMIEQLPVSEDFTFPTLAHDSSPPNLGFPSFTASSSLWRVPPTLPNFRHVGSELDHDVAEETQKQKPLLSVEDGKREGSLPRETDFYSLDHLDDDSEVSSVYGEEKMDMLWEDFNDELGRIPSWCANEVGKINGSLKDWVINVESDVDSAQMAEIGHSKALKVSKNACLLHHGRPSLLVILRVVKKFFLLHHSSHSPKRP